MSKTHTLIEIADFFLAVYEDLADPDEDYDQMLVSHPTLRSPAHREPVQRS